MVSVGVGQSSAPLLTPSLSRLRISRQMALGGDARSEIAFWSSAISFIADARITVLLPNRYLIPPTEQGTTQTGVEQPDTSNCFWSETLRRAY